MITWIGLCAGEIWTYLESHSAQARMEELFAGIQAPRQTILMAVGWLAREGYVLMEGELPNPLIKLNLKPTSETAS